MRHAGVKDDSSPNKRVKQVSNRLREMKKRRKTTEQGVSH